MEIISGLAYHCNHNVLISWVWDFNERLDYIRLHKPQNEQALRIRLYQVISEDRLPDEPFPILGESTPLRAEAISEYMLALVALHQELCPDCPWNGVTIFTRQNADGEWY